MSDVTVAVAHPLQLQKRLRLMGLRPKPWNLDRSLSMLQRSTITSSEFRSILDIEFWFTPLEIWDICQVWCFLKKISDLGPAFYISFISNVNSTIFPKISNWYSKEKKHINFKTPRENIWKLLLTSLSKPSQNRLF